MSSALPALPREDLVLDRYRPLRPLGSGGSGSVWLARDEHNGLDVALKIVPREGKAALRAEREAEAAARLRHERCLRAYAFGGDAGHVYIAYEYVGGRTLRDALRSRSLSDADAIEACAQILEGLAHAHGRGIVHRDVKPSNVLLADEQPPSVRLLDFGLAQWDEAETLTAVGDVPGTLAYISPERLRGEEACAASDVWAVGIVLWEALAAKHPFWGVALPQMARAIAAGPPSLAQERPDLPERLVAAVARALDPAPARRPSAAALAAELRDTTPRRPRTRPRRPPRPKPHAAAASLRLPAVPTLRLPAAPRLRLPPLARPQLPGLTAAGRLVPPALAGVTALAGASLLPFYPAHWGLALAAAAAATAALTPRLGVALALAVPLLPLGNLALGLALLWAALAVGWLALAWREPRAALAVVVGPLLAPLGLLGLVPLLVRAARGHVLRAAQASGAVALAAVVAATRGGELPFGLGAAPELQLAGAESPVEVARALVLATPVPLALELAVFAAIALALPFARTPWRIALLGAGVAAATVLAAPAGPALPLLAAAWLTCAWLVWERHAAAVRPQQPEH
ncbi:MAG TPA: serine/threonine-protein kinase [Gaiellaceae bacterium]|nr:serine/threonine-protein kinase [Gaiellaceae bacterium]